MACKTKIGSRTVIKTNRDFYKMCGMGVGMKQEVDDKKMEMCQHLQAALGHFKLPYPSSIIFTLSLSLSNSLSEHTLPRAASLVHTDPNSERKHEWRKVSRAVRASR
uniref:Uncharacterized protein n=1 Tax=Trypanosoma vivax (strain Y486) TaxID=1055687 RepID=G0U6B6_TRYVY|nr:hypothetical protein, unlikely [Trypanosoma vivax Y486]